MMAPLMAPDRVRLFLSLVPYLSERGQVALSEAAADFGVTEKVMRGMVEKLTVIGLPGEDGYWQLDQDLFNINWDLLDAEDVIELTNTVALQRAPRLTAREAAALLSGLRQIQALPGIDDGGVVASLAEKLARGASHAPADVVVAPVGADAVRDAVASALRQGTALSFTYHAPGQSATTRTVDPLRIQITGGEWYLQGWCHLRRAARTFNLVRVSDPIVTDIPATHRLEDVPPQQDDTADEIVELRLPASSAPLLGRLLRTAEQRQDGEELTARIPFGDATAAKRIAARHAGAVRVMQPVSAREATRRWAQAALDLYPEAAEHSDHPTS